ncbi:2-succinyl-5-enolpyruvyl-6-hydroxy-3-cyclohexene-1-carboxylic-acid synthase [Amycolatopsis sp. GM8]|uniref:2-succinyl-5-enolpyruvyl-6-hydroxy-3- cyclohexene-1-carboxylic-acid synthase n=1 Tax=Amycolatopsis sp. GM8 TaxID=2896530 RepID=UPI001F005473|nr:2-succinyl-5-enolpyruvyl-6-hydroxy-3-cyclohexene-1-carboxylic-acid synthase [Amycolatopsis sp. GM8]
MNPATAQAEVIVDELARSGVRQVVLCPGGRSAPLARALHRAADSGRLELHVRVDERSAAFLALGLAQGSGRPVPVVCTSGTAVANLHPAVLEAHYARIGLLLLTADRPPELHHTGASQTIAQFGLFGMAARAIEFPIAERRSGQNPVWRDLICRAIAWAGAGQPVQLNIPFREPLTPVLDRTWSDDLMGRPDGKPWTTLPERDVVFRNHTGIELPANTLVVMGSSDPQRVRAVAEVAAEAGWPVIAEPTAVAPARQSGASVLRCGVLLLAGGELPTGIRHLPSPLRPEAVLLVGRPTLSPDVGPVVGDVPVLSVDAYPEWSDPAHTVRHVEEWLDVDDVPHAKDPNSKWLDLWAHADRTVAAVVDEALDAEPSLTGLRVARDLMAALPPQAMLFLGASNTIRDIYMAAEARADVTVHANRGVAGIDGNISTAVGLALGLNSPEGPKFPCYALMGDLTFLHDTNGLLVGPEERRPNLTLVVLNDHGGGNFSLLPDGAPEHRRGFERVFATPHDTDLAELCAAHHVAHTVIDDPGQLAAVLHQPPVGLRVAEIRADRDILRIQHIRLHKALTAVAASMLNAAPA